MRLVDKGKNNIGYSAYNKQVPRDTRKPKTMQHPRTPDHKANIPNQRWLGMVSTCLSFKSINTEMMMTLQLPEGYIFVVLACVFLPTIMSLLMGAVVMMARKKHSVLYPNLYAVPGLHEEADAFNRIQRGHQNYLEGLSSYTTMSLLGGFHRPHRVAVGGIFFSIGSLLYQIGYSDVKFDAQTARFRRGGFIKWVGFFISLMSTIELFGYPLIGW